MSSTRGEFLRQGVATAAALGLGAQFLRDPGVARAVTGARGPYGALLPPVNGVALPSGFSSRLIATSGLPVGTTSYPWHVAPDGAGALATAGGGWVLAGNSEDNGTSGGASAIRFNRRGEIVDAYRILGGTKWNCAGGVTPWRTWLSCEEFRNGLVWECYPLERGRSAVARPALGTFIHEAAAVDPSGTVYLTEDSYDARLYRFVPHVYGSLGNGTLYAAKAASNGGPVSWVETSPDRPNRDKDTAVFARGEGAWIDRGFLYFTTTGDDRVWELDLEAQPQQLRVIYDGVANPSAPLHSPDNITVHPSTGDLFVAEDGDDLQLVQLRKGQDGAWSAAVFLQFVGHDGSEVAGPAFSPDGSRLYVSSQRGTDGKRGLTFEIKGPFVP